jgi:hypothetical protein
MKRLEWEGGRGGGEEKRMRNEKQREGGDLVETKKLKLDCNS